uniref:Uncharacterized protein n=1 Tax=viral metagenome TaxID=1070528 RepID=A0A6M3KU84_9ZZZZ
MDNINNWIVVIFHHNTIIDSVGPFYTWTDANQWSQLWTMLATDIKNKVSYKQLLIQHLELRIEPHTN